MFTEEMKQTKIIVETFSSYASMYFEIDADCEIGR